MRLRPASYERPRCRGTFGGVLGVLGDERLESRLHGNRDPLRLRRLALGPADDPVADPADLGLETPEQLTGADELLPPGKHLSAQQRAVGGSPRRPWRWPRRRRGRRRRAAARPWRPARRRRRRPGSCAWRSMRTAPSSVCLTTDGARRRHRRGCRASSRMYATADGGSRPSSLTVPSVTANSGESLSPRLVSILARWPLTSSTAAVGCGRARWPRRRCARPRLRGSPRAPGRRSARPT